MKGAMNAAIYGAIQRKKSHDRLTGPFGARGATVGPCPLNCAFNGGRTCAFNCVMNCAVLSRSLIAA
eukprot:11852959-Alexandrium_andersonii.AAC.1